MLARRAATSRWSRVADCISLRTNTGADCISAEKIIKMPSGATTNVQLNELPRRMRVSYFRGVFMHNMLSTSGAHRNESDIVNLDDATGPGTHWVAYAKRNNRVVYFNSFGNLRPPKELVQYFGNDDRVQSHVLSDVRSELLDRCICSFYCINGKRA